MNTNDSPTKPFFSEDKVILQKLRSKAWITLLRLYGPLFLMLVYVYYEMQPGGTFRGHKLKYSKGEFNTVFPYFAAVFAAVFIIYVVKDFRRLILPFIREARMNTKRCYAFAAKKYHDPIYDKYLLFYPGREDFYIEICSEDFNSIGNGEDMYLEVAPVTGEVLYLKSPDRVFKDPEEFSFSDR